MFPHTLFRVSKIALDPVHLLYCMIFIYHALTDTREHNLKRQVENQHQGYEIVICVNNVGEFIRLLSHYFDAVELLKQWKCLGFFVNLMPSPVKKV